MPNDSIWFSNFDWVNSDNPAKFIKLDVCWKEIGGNTFSFLDARLENGLYVTIGLRQTDGGCREASMSVFKHGASPSIFKQVSFDQKERFYCNPGNEEDKYCKGSYQFELGEYYQFIMEVKEEKIIGSICRLADQGVTEIATFLTGEGSLIKAKSSNGIALEHFGMIDPCEHKSEIIIRAPVRIDVNGFHSVARGGFVSYQRCLNSSIEKIPSGGILLSHGGDAIRGNINHGDFIKLD